MKLVQKDLINEFDSFLSSEDYLYKPSWEASSQEESP